MCEVAKLHRRLMRAWLALSVERAYSRRQHAEIIALAKRMASIESKNESLREIALQAAKLAQLDAFGAGTISGDGASENLVAHMQSIDSK